MTESAQLIDESLDIPKGEYQIILIYILRYIFFYLLFAQILTASSQDLTTFSFQVQELFFFLNT